MTLPKFKAGRNARSAGEAYLLRREGDLCRRAPSEAGKSLNQASAAHGEASRARLRGRLIKRPSDHASVRTRDP